MMLIITITNEAQQRPTVEIMYHVSYWFQFPLPPFSVWLLFLPSFLCLFSLSVSHLYTTYPLCMCDSSSSISSDRRSLNQTESHIWCNSKKKKKAERQGGPRRLSTPRSRLRLHAPHVSRVALKRLRPRPASSLPHFIPAQGPT
jgi:hypothetical protein